ncbi:uncharacterized protein LOC141660436 [Apium graveolens]|uniref:uncharacterized protein LOC141660436 n=1 Tax=Apium graveolens TaxID=4045 RepID=UPI003D79C6F7
MATAEIPSPFSVAVREAQLLAGYRNTTSDLRFHGSSDPVEFLGRFNIEMHCDGSFRRSLEKILIAGLRVGSDFWKHSQGKDPATLVDVFALAESFKAIEQSLAEVQPITQASQRNKAMKRDRSPSPSRYTPLAASIEHIFEVNKNRGLFRKPEALSSCKSKDKKKYYEYHESSVHNTHECRQLKDEIEALIKEGYLGEWVVKEVRRHKDSTDRAKEEGGRAPRGSNNETLEENKFVRDNSIRTIYGGDLGMECSNRALERYAREARFRPLTDIHRVETRLPKVFKGESMDITYREADAQWVHHPHNDALVISIQIGTKNIHRAFVDNGSSTNILYYSTFKKMGLPDRDILGEDSWVYGFYGAGVRVMGLIRLPCT